MGIIGDFNLSYKVVLMRPWVRFLKAQVVIKRSRLVPPHFLFDFSLWCNLSLLWTLLLWCHILWCCIVTSIATKEKINATVWYWTMSPSNCDLSIYPLKHITNQLFFKATENEQVYRLTLVTVFTTPDVIIYYYYLPPRLDS